jgi:two-component system CheB/CheR fusion protein
MGRPIGDIRPNVSIPDLEPLLAEVIDTVSPRELEVRTRRALVLAARCGPTRRVDNKIEGAVLMLVDIDPLKRGEETLRRQAELLDQTYEPILVWRFDGTIVYWNRGAESVLRFTREQAIGRDRTSCCRPPPTQGLPRGLRRDGQWTGGADRTGRGREADRPREPDGRGAGEGSETRWCSRPTTRSPSASGWRRRCASAPAS